MGCRPRGRGGAGRRRVRGARAAGHRHARGPDRRIRPDGQAGGPGPVPRQPQGRGRRHAGQLAHPGRRAARPRQDPRGRPLDVEARLLLGRPGRGHPRAARRRAGHLRGQGKAVGPQDPGKRQRRARPGQDQRGPRPQARRHPGRHQDQTEPREDPRPVRREGLLPGGGRVRGKAGQRVGGRRLVRRRRALQGRDPRGLVHRQPAHPGQRPGRRHRHAARRRHVVPHRLRHLPGGAVRARPAHHHRLLLRPRLHQREAGDPPDPAVARQEVHVRVDPDRRGPGVRHRLDQLQGRPDRAERGLLRAPVHQAGRGVQPQQGLRGHQQAQRLLQGQGLRLRQHHAGHQCRPQEADRRTRLRDREGQEGLLRAHQHPRQLQDARQGGPPRDEDRRGRALQPDQARRVEALRHRAGLLREGGRVDPARRRPTSSSRSTSRSPSGRPAPSRSAPASRRSRTSSPRPRSRRTTCSAAARPWRCRPSCPACASCSCSASSSPGSSTPGGRSRSTCSTRAAPSRATCRETRAVET